MDCLKWQVMSGWSYMLSLLLSKQREATFLFIYFLYYLFISAFFWLCPLHVSKQTDAGHYIEIRGCAAAAAHCAEGWSSYKAINLHHSWRGSVRVWLPAGRVRRVAVLAARVSQARRGRGEQKKEKITCRSGTDWAGGLEVRRPCQADGWQYTLLSPVCPCLHTPTLYRHFLNTVCRAKLEGRNSTWLSLMHFSKFFLLHFWAALIKVMGIEAN